MIEAIIGLAGVIVGSILTALNAWVVHVFQKRTNGRYAAVRIIAVLDEYAQDCVSVVFDDGTSEGRPAGVTDQGEEYCIPQATRPSPPVFPDDIDWRSISFKLMYRILSLPNAARKTDRHINASSEYAYPPDYEEVFDARQEGYAHLGLEAVSLINDLRTEFGLPGHTVAFRDSAWNTEKFFRDKVNEFQERRKNDDA